MKTRTLIIILSIWLFGTCLTYGIADDFEWPRWRGPNGDGISLEANWDPETLVGGPKVLWNVDVGMGYSNVAIKDNRLYTVGIEGVVCLNAETGEEIWRYADERFGDPKATPTIEGKYVYTLSHEGMLFCLKVKNGKLRWKKDLVADYGAVRPLWGFAGSPVIEGELLILTANTAGMALNRKTGQVVWSSDKPPKKFQTLNTETTGVDYSTPVIYDHEGKRYALITSWKGVSSVEVETGKPLWLNEWDSYTGSQVPDPVIIGNKVYVVESITSKKSTASRLFEITDEGPTVLWRSPDLYTEITSPVIVDGYIYGCQGGPYSGTASLRCIDLETGRLIWDESFPDEPYNPLGQKSISLMVADGKLIILSAWGMLYIAEATPTGYKEISRCDVYNGEEKIRKFWTPSVLYKGKIYCRNWAGDLVCIDVSK